MIGIIVALEDELNSYKTLTEKFNIHISQNQKFYIFYQNDNMFVLTFSGVGKVNAAYSAFNMIKTFNIKKIINIGSCGSFKKDIKINDTIIVDKFYYLDVDATAFGYQLGQVPKEKPFYFFNNNLKHEIISCFDKNDINYINSNIGTSDSFINQNNFSNLYNANFDLISCFDMEATSIAQICDKNEVDFVAIKNVSDNILDSISNSDQFHNHLKQVAIKLTNIIKLIIEYYS